MSLGEVLSHELEREFKKKKDTTENRKKKTKKPKE